VYSSLSGGHCNVCVNLNSIIFQMKNDLVNLLNIFYDISIGIKVNYFTINTTVG